MTFLNSKQYIVSFLNSKQYIEIEIDRNEKEFKPRYDKLEFNSSFRRSKSIYNKKKKIIKKNKNNLGFTKLDINNIFVVQIDFIEAGKCKIIYI